MTYTEPPDLTSEMLPLRDAPQQGPSCSLKAGLLSEESNNTFQIMSIQSPLPRVREDNYQHDLTGKFSTLEHTVVTFTDGIVSMHGRNGAFC